MPAQLEYLCVFKLMLTSTDKMAFRIRPRANQVRPRNPLRMWPGGGSSCAPDLDFESSCSESEMPVSLRISVLSQLESHISGRRRRSGFQYWNGCRLQNRNAALPRVIISKFKSDFEIACLTRKPYPTFKLSAPGRRRRLRSCDSSSSTAVQVYCVQSESQRRAFNMSGLRDSDFGMESPSKLLCASFVTDEC
jgi:hypothetical protein